SALRHRRAADGGADRASRRLHPAASAAPAVLAALENLLHTRLLAGDLALAQVVLGGAGQRQRTHGKRRLGAIELHHDTTVVAHADALDLIRAGEHMVLSGEVAGDAIDRLLHAERLAAANAREGLGLVEAYRLARFGR